MRDIPISVFLSVPTPNYKNPPTHGPSLFIINAVFLFLCTVFVSLRLYTRTFIKRCLGWDDVCLVVGFVFAAGLAADVMLANNKYYWDRHIYDIPLDAAPGVGKTAIAAKELFTVAATFIRMALLLFYYRLVADTNMRPMRWALHCTVAFNFAVFIAVTFLTIFQCWPVSAYWTFGTSNKCLDEGKVTISAGVINCVADLLVTALPIPMVLRLRMPLAQRLGVAILLSLGFIVTVAGVARTYFIWKALVESYDETWYAYPLWICAAVEIQLGVITACVPPLRPFFALYIPALSNSLHNFTDKISSFRSRSSKQNTAVQSGSNTSPQPLSKMYQSIDSDVEGYNLGYVEKVKPLDSGDLTSPNPYDQHARSHWQIYQRQSVEVKSDAIIPPPDLNKEPLPSWPMARNGAAQSPTTPSNHGCNRSGSKVFTRWLHSQTSSEQAATSTASPESSRPSHDQHRSAAIVTAHPLRHDDSPPRAKNFSTPFTPYPPNAYGPDPNLVWPVQEPPGSTMNPRRSRSDGHYHRVEIKRNPLRQAKMEEEKKRRRTSTGLAPETEKHGGDSRATSMTDHFA